jgi:hypothetical protein
LRSRAIEITAKPSIDPPGGRRLRIVNDDGVVLDERLPRRFPFVHRSVPAIGDWEIDQRQQQQVVLRREVMIRGPFVLSIELEGRTSGFLGITLDGPSPVSLWLRQGLTDNDMYICDEDGVILASTSIDPRPAAAVGSALATLLRACAIAAALIALWSLLGMVSSRPSTVSLPQPSTSFLWASVGLLAVAAIGISWWTSASVLDALPHEPDSVVYLHQAKWLRSGHLTGEDPPFPEHQHVPFTYRVDGRLIGHYPIGWPLLLAVGLAAGAPFLVAPLLAGLYAVLLFLLGREAGGPWIGLVAAVLSLISPMARLSFANFMPHSASSTAIVLFLWLSLVSRRTGRSLPMALAAVSIGFAFAVRPLTAVAVAMAGGLVILRDLAAARTRGERAAPARRLWVMLGAGMIATLPTMLVNLEITGNPFKLSYWLVQGSMYGVGNIPFGLRNLDAILTSIPHALFGWGWGVDAPLLLLALPLAFACIPFLTRRATGTDWFLLGVLGTLLVAHVGTRAHGLHGFGPRYAFDAFCCLYILTARGFQELARGRSDIGFGRVTTSAAACLFLCLNLQAALHLGHRLDLYAGYNGVTDSLERQIEAAGIDCGLILFADDAWQGWAMATPYLMTNPPGDLVFACSTDDNTQLLEAMRDQPVYTWNGVCLTDYRE